MNAQTDRLLDLLAARATEGLSPEAEKELGTLLASHEEHDPLDWELAAAAATNAFAMQSGTGRRMPAGLKERLLEDADRRFRAHHPGRSASITDLNEARARRREAEKETKTGGGFGAFNRLGWAAAAVLLIALVVVNRPEVEDTAPVEMTAEARAEALEQQPGTIVVRWSPPDIDEYSAVTGDVVWNNDAQEGYMRLAGMPVNDPAVAQYQLWIVDPDRDSRPVDGGVFDISGGTGEVVIPIDAKLGIVRPQAFAITLEQPGGVVVSDGPLLVVASAG